MCRQAGLVVVVGVEFLNLVHHQQMDVVVEEGIGQTAAHKFNLRCQEYKSVAAVFCEYLCDIGFGVVLHGYAVERIFMSFAVKAQQGHGLESAFDLDFQS